MKKWRTNHITRINTAQGLSYTLFFYFGLKNSMVQLVEFDFPKLENLKAIFDNLIMKNELYYSRSNQITFTESNNDDKLPWLDKQLSQYYIKEIKKTNFKFQINAYSNVNPTVEFHIDVKVDTITEDDGSSKSVSTETLEKDSDTVLNKLSQQTAEAININPDPVQQQSDSSSFHKSKKAFVDKLEKGVRER